jgi:hypothetical protein
MLKTDGWPVVVVEDLPPVVKDRCLYCRMPLGQPHGMECVKVLKAVELELRAEGRRVGTFKEYEPWCWRREDIEHYWNEGNACLDNVTKNDTTVWTAGEARAEAERLAGEGGDNCCCSYLSVRLLRVIDRGPFVDREEG